MSIAEPTLAMTFAFFWTVSFTQMNINPVSFCTTPCVLLKVWCTKCGAQSVVLKVWCCEQAEQQAVSDAVEAVTNVTKAIWPQSRTVLFGSQATTLALPGSDLDIVILGVSENITNAASGFTKCVCILMCAYNAGHGHGLVTWQAYGCVYMSVVRDLVQVSGKQLSELYQSPPCLLPSQRV